VNAVSLKLKYAGTAFLAVLVAAFAFICLFAWQLHIHSQRIESLAQAAVHATVTPGTAPAATPSRLAASGELLRRLHLASQNDLLNGLVLAAVLAGAAGLVAAWLAWRAGFRLEQPITALIRSAERFGQGDYTRPVDIAAPRRTRRPAAGAGAHALKAAPDDDHQELPDQRAQRHDRLRCS
jgi:HAMP domain-containing protein